MECASSDSKNRAAAGFIQRFQNTTQCSAGLGAAPQQAEKPFVLWKRNEWFLAFVYTDALLATIVKAMRIARYFTFLLAASNASGAPYAKNAHFCFGRLARFPACWETSQAL